MPWKTIQEGTTTKYKVYAFYELHGSLYMLNASRDTIEQCHEWLKNHKTKEVPKSFDSFALAKMSNYNIFEETLTRKIVEHKKV